VEDDFVGVKFYCPHALANGNQHIRIREKTLEFSSTCYSVSVPQTNLIHAIVKKKKKEMCE